MMKSLRFVLAGSAAALASIIFAPAAAARTEIANGAQPQLAVGSDGRVWLVYAQTSATPSAHAGAHDHHAAPAEGKKHDGKKHKSGHGPQGRAGDVFVARSSDGGVTFGAPVK